jgi:hypothetical protein
MSRLGWCLIIGTLVLCAAACAGSKPTAHRSAVSSRGVSTQRHCGVEPARARRALHRIQIDIARIRRATTHAQTSAATDKFITDLDRSGIALKDKNRLIDHAVSASLGKCDDCFQALEAMRPIPSIAHGCG